MLQTTDEDSETSDMKSFTQQPMKPIKINNSTNNTQKPPTPKPTTNYQKNPKTLPMKHVRSSTSHRSQEISRVKQ